MFYVNMVDKFMSGWGEAKHGRSILCIECDTLAQANAVERAARDRSEMRYVTVASAPRKGRPGDMVTTRTFRDLGGHWLDYVKNYT